MPQPTTIRDIIYRLCNSRDGELDLYQRELKYYLIRRGLFNQS